MKITKAVIAAAGWSTRFLPAVKSYAKHLVPIWDKPQIQYLVEECIASGITQICIVHRHGEKTLKQHFQYDPTLEEYLNSTNKQKHMDSLHQIWQKIENFKFIPQARSLPYGNGSPILAAKSFIDSDPFVFMYGDDFVLENQPGKYLSSLISTFIKQKAEAVCGVQQVLHSEINRYSSVQFKKNSDYKNQIQTVIEKPPVDQAPSDLTLFGRFIFSPQIIDVLKTTTTSRGELWLTDAVNTLAQSKLVIAQATTKDSPWLTTGDPLNWLKANLLFTRQNPDIYPQIKEFLKKL